MPGCVVDFGYDKIKMQPEKLSLFENIYLHFVRSDDKL